MTLMGTILAKSFPMGILQYADTTMSQRTVKTAVVPASTRMYLPMGTSTSRPSSPMLADT